jgi:ATP-dependent DNA helicase DinG
VLEMSWTKLPFAARNREEFSRGLIEWLGHVFYDRLPELGYEVREEQIYTSFQMARALVSGTALFAEAGTGTGKTFAYLLPAVAYARFTGRPVVVASGSAVLQSQLTNPDGDILTLSRVLGLNVDARLAFDSGEYLCKVKVKRYVPPKRTKGWKALSDWAGETTTGARSEVPTVPDELWADVAWDPSLPCDTCKQRGTCHLIAARRHYRAAADLIVTDHHRFAEDLLTRAERLDLGQMPLLPAYAAVVLDEGHHVPDVWQRAQGHKLSAPKLKATLELILSRYANPALRGRLAEARAKGRAHLANVLIAAVRRESEAFLTAVITSAGPEEGKRHVVREGAALEAAARLVSALEAMQDDLVMEESMQEGTGAEITLRAYQARLDGILAALSLFQSDESVAWLEGDDLWVVPRKPLPLVAPERLSATTPVLFSSATLEADYMARTLQLPRHETSRAGVPFNLAEQVLVYEAGSGAELEQVAAVLRAMQGRTLVLLKSLAEVRRYKQALAKLRLPWRILYEGDAARPALLKAFRENVPSVLVGASFWEGVDVPGEALSCVLIPRLPFPLHDPLIGEQREQATARGEDPFLTVDLPEMLLKLKQGTGRLIRTTADRGVLALLDRSHLDQPWAESVAAVLPEGAERTTEIARVAGFAAARKL